MDDSCSRPLYTNGFNNTNVVVARARAVVVAKARAVVVARARAVVVAKARAVVVARARTVVIVQLMCHINHHDLSV